MGNRGSAALHRGFARIVAAAVWVAVFVGAAGAVYAQDIVDHGQRRQAGRGNPERRKRHADARDALFGFRFQDRVGGRSSRWRAIGSSSWRHSTARASRSR